MFYKVGKAWSRVTDQCIASCWKKGLNGNELEPAVICEEELDMEELEHMLAGTVISIDREAVEQYVAADTTAPTHETVDTETESPCCASVVPEDDEDMEIIVPPTTCDMAIDGLGSALRFLETQHDLDDQTLMLMRLEGMICTCKKLKQKKSRQSSIVEFLS